MLKQASAIVVLSIYTSFPATPKDKHTLAITLSISYFTAR